MSICQDDIITFSFRAYDLASHGVLAQLTVLGMSSIFWSGL